MARYIAPKCRLCRREGMKLFLKGQRCLSEKCALSRRDYPPGVHAQRRRKVTEYGVRLREKQKLKGIYQVLEKQFRRYFKEAERLKGNTGDNLMILLERRLDNVVLASGFSVSRCHSRQLVNHGHFTVNGKRVTIPSFQVRPGDVVAPGKKENTRKSVAEALELNKKVSVPVWLSVDSDAMSATISAMPTRADIAHPIQEQLIIELCSK